MVMILITDASNKTHWHLISVQELVRTCDSERELFHDDIVHVEASAYAH